MRIGNHTKLSNSASFDDVEWPLTLISRSRYYSASKKLETGTIQSYIYNGRPIKSRIWSVERRHFQWSWTTPNPGFKVTPLFDAKYLTHCYRYGHSYYSYTQLRTPNACTNATVTQTDTQTPHDGIGRACIASRGKNNKNLAIANRSRVIWAHQAHQAEHTMSRASVITPWHWNLN